MRSLILTSIVVLGAAAGYFGYRELRERNLASETKASEPAVPGAPATPPREFNPGNVQELLRGRALQALALKCRPGDCSISVRVVEQRTCELGDLDVIGRLVGSDDRLTLSIEPLSPEPSFAGEATPLTLKELSGFKHRFSLNGISLYARLGIFLCRDSHNEGICVNKPAAPLVNAPGFGAKGTDSNYYFQPLVLTGDDQFVSASAPTTPMDAAYFALFEWVGKHSVEQTAARLLEERKKAHALAIKIGSLPLVVEGNELTLPLAHHAADCPVNKKYRVAPIPQSPTARKFQKLLKENPEALRQYANPPPVQNKR